MSSFVGPGPPECAYRVGYICFGSQTGAVAYCVIIGVALLVAIVSGVIAWARRR